MATEDLFALLREGNRENIWNHVLNLQDLTAVENAILSDPTLLDLADKVR